MERGISEIRFQAGSRTTCRATRLKSALICLCFALSTVGLLLAGPASAKPHCLGKIATVSGGSGGNVLRGTSGNDVIVAGGGPDRVLSGAGRDLICAGSGGDRIFGGGGRDQIAGSGGDDYISGGLGRDTIRAGGGADVIIGGPGGEVADGGSGADRIYGGQQDDRLRGGSGDDLLIGDQGLDRLLGGDGSDWLRGDTGTSLYDGGTGSDWLSFAASSGGGLADLAEGKGGGGTFSNGALRDIENVLGTGFADTLRGGIPGAIAARGLGFRPNLLGGSTHDECEGFVSIDCGQDATGGAVPAVLADQSPIDPGVRVYGGPGAESFRVSATPSGVRVQGSSPLAAGPGCAGGGHLRSPARWQARSDTSWCKAAPVTTRSAWTTTSAPRPRSIWTGGRATIKFTVGRETRFSTPVMTSLPSVIRLTPTNGPSADRSTF